MAIIFSGNGVINTNGVVPIAQGGTGQITPDAAINALLPSQSGKNGQILSTDGATVKWIVNTGGTGGSGTGLPEQTGASGNFLTTDGTTAYWSPVIAAGIQAGGVDGQLQFNNNNVLTATPKMFYNSLDVLFVGGGTSDTFKIEGVDAFDNTYTGTTVVIKGGDSFANPLPTATPPAGDVIIMGGGGFGQGAAGNIIFKVGQIQAETFRITNTGAWALGGDKSLVGSSGNILVSQGSGGPPIWIPTPIATSTVLGGVKVAANSGLTVDSTGFISANIKSADGSTIKNVDGLISVDLYKVLPEIPANTSGRFLKASSTSLVEWAPVALNDVLPTQSGKDGLVLTTNGNTANWASPYPSQTDKAGQFLVTDGTSVSWSSNPSTIATTEGIGAVKPDGSTITVTEDGTVSANVNSILPDQTGNENKLLTTDGTSLSWVAAPEQYVLPVATSSTLGGVTPGVGVTVSPSGALNLAPPTGTNLGGIKPGPGTVLEPDGTLGVQIQNASAEGLGLVRVGAGLSINSDGILSVVGGGSGSGGGGSGTVTEVEISSTDLSVTTSPITSSGKIAIGLGLNTVPVNKGGTGLQQIGVGELLVGAAGNTYQTIAPAATFNVLLSNGTDARPVYGKVNLNNHVAGVLPIQYGGTGASTPQGAVENLFGFTPVDRAGDTMTGPLTLSGAPTSALQAATKQYVDNLASGLTVKEPVRVATTQNITATYAASKLSGSGALSAIDTITLSVNDRVLVKNQTNKNENGVYVVSALNPFVLDRASDATSISAGDAFFVKEGSQASTIWVVGSDTAIIVGTTNIEYLQFSGPAELSTGLGIDIQSNVIRNTGIVNITGGSNITVSAKNESGVVSVSFDGVLSAEKGGTGHSEYSTGDLLYASDATTLSKIPVGSAGQILTVVGTVPSWNNPIVSEIKVNEQKGFKGVVNNSNGLVDITISTTTSGLLKGNSSTGEVISAVAGVDYQAPISLTTTGTSGPATLVDGVLNIPQYSGGGGGGSTYTLPTASNTVLGGVKIDNTTITIANGVISSQINALLPTQDSQSGKFLTTNGAGTLSWDLLGVSAATTTELGGIKIDSAVSVIDEAGFYKTTKLSLNSQQNKQILFNDNGVSSTAGKLLYNNTELKIGAASDSKFDITSATDLNLIAADEKNVSITTKELKVYTYNDSQYAMLESCRTVTTANIEIIGGNATTLQIAAGSDLALFDNVNINVGDRILFKNQVNQSLNRVYVMTLKDHPFVWMFTITSDFENAITNSKIPVVEITEGSLSGSKLQGTINGPNITWEEFDPSTLYTKNFEILRTGAVSFGPTTNTGVQGQTLISNADLQSPVWGTLGVKGGGTGKTSFSPGFLKSDGAEISSAALSVNDIPALPINKISETVPVNKGGTGATSLTGYIVGSGTDPLIAVSKIPLSDISGTITVDPENINSPVTIQKGGTGANNAAAALLNLNAVSKSGDTITGPLILNYSPTQALEAVNKSYVDSYVNGLTVYDSVKTATGSNLTATYNNGTNGVGATLTGSSSLGGVEGVSVELNERILVRKQTNPIENGIYVVTSLSNPWVLTRASDFNSNSNALRGSAVFVTEGNFTGTQWVMTSDTVNVGTTPIKFTQFTGPGVLVGESGILIDGNKISNTGVTKLIAGTNISLTGQTGEITIAVDGVLPISKGGTGLSTTSYGYLFSDGTALSYSSTVPVAHLSGKILVANGGTGASTPDQARTNLGAAKSGINTDIVSALGIKEISAPEGNYGQTDLLIKAGNGVLTQSGGNITLESGTPTPTSTSSGQSVYIDMPVISSSPNGGAFAIRHKLISVPPFSPSVSYAHRFGINRQGAFTIGETLSTGSAGQFLKSNGSNSAPTWSNLPSINEVLPSQTGKAGRFLQSDGTNVTWQSMNTIPVNGNNGEVLYNWNGAVTPATNMVFNNIDTLTLGTISGLNKQDLFYFKTPNGQRSGNNVLAPMGISFKPGTQVEANGAPGNVFIGGSSATGVGSQGGSVYLDGGNSTFSQGGSVIIRTTGGPGTALVNRLAIVPNGAWNINGSTGTLGQVLISSGSSASPEWRNATVDAQYIIGTTLASNVVNSSLTKVGTLTDLNVAGSVGIGTTTPKAPLSVSLGNSAEGIEFVPSITSSSIRAINRASDTFSPIEVGGSTVTLRTISGVNLTDRLKITSTGSWELNGLAGTAGYVLTNKGPNFPPAWEAGLQTINGGTTGLTFTKNDTEITVAGTLNVSNGGTGATTAIQASQNVANFGNLRAHGAVSDFNMVREWGATYVTGNTNGPTGVPNPYDQNYQLMLSLGNNYNWNSNNIYAAQIAIPRNATNPVISIRFKEGGDSSSNWGTWQKITAGAAETLSQTLSIEKGGTGATTPAAAARAILTPGSTDNGKYLKWDANSNAVMWDTVIVDATKITGVIPHNNGGTGGGSRQAGLNSLAGVIGALANTVLRFDGTNVLLDKLNVSTDISGTLPIANGGTGASTQAAAARAILPPQSGATVNQFLMSDGTNSSWKTAVTSVNISGLQTGLTFNGGPITGTGTFELSGVLKVSNGGTGANFLTAGFVKSNGSNAFTSVAGITSDDISGTLGINKGGTGATTQAAAARAILAPQPGDSGKVLVTDGANVSWGTATVSANSFTGTLAVEKGGTGATTASAAINALLPTQTSNNGRYLSTNGSSVSWQTISITPDNITGTLPVGKGGTGLTTYANGDLLVGNTSNTLSRLSAGSANQVLTITNGVPAWVTPSVSAGGSAAGEIQYRSSTGTLAASNTFTFNTSTNKVSFTNVPQIGSGASALDIGYLVLPRTTTFDANAKGKRVALTAGITIPANVYAAGDAFSFYNDSASPITLTQGSGLTLRKDGTTTTGNLVLAARGTALLWFNSATEAILTGSIT